MYYVSHGCHVCHPWCSTRPTAETLALSLLEQRVDTAIGTTDQAVGILRQRIEEVGQQRGGKDAPKVEADEILVAEAGKVATGRQFGEYLAKLAGLSVSEVKGLAQDVVRGRVEAVL